MPRKGLNNDMLVKAAAELIEEKGYERFSLTSLAEKLNVKAASLYNHMNNIGELLSEVGSFALKKLNAELQDGMNMDDPESALLSIAIGYRKFAKDNPELYKTIMKIPVFGDVELLNKGIEIIHGLYETLDSFGLSKYEKIHFSRSFRASMHGFVTLEEMGFFADSIDAAESYLYMIKSLIQPLTHNRGGLKENRIEELL